MMFKWSDNLKGIISRGLFYKHHTVSILKNAYLTDRFFAGYGLWQIVGVIGLLHTGILALYLVGTVCIIALVWVDRRSLLKGEEIKVGLTLPRSLELEQTISPAATLSFVQENPLMPARIEWEAPSLPAFQFHTRVAPFESGQAGQFEPAGSGLRAAHAATAAALGYFEWNSLRLVVHSRFGLWYQTIELAIEPQGIRVHPSFRRIPEQDFVERTAGQQILTQGSHKLLRGQAADQFHSIRRYQYADNRRHIDAKKSAKYAQLMTRVYEASRSHHLILALDLGRSMCGRLKDSAKHDYYLSACLMLAQNAIAAGDHVSFFAFANTVTYAIRNSRHLANFEPLFKGDPRLRAHETSSRYDLLYPTICSLSGQRSIVLVLTDLTNPSVQQGLLGSLIAVCQRHLTLAVGLQDQSLFLNEMVWGLDPDHLSEEEQARLLYAAWLNDHFGLFRLHMARLGGGVVQGSDDTWISLTTQVYTQLRESLRA